MLKGVHLTLLVGPVVPVPVPQLVLDALTQIEVSAPDEAAGAFTLQFTLSVQSPLHTLFLLSGGGVVPLLRVIVVVTLNGMPQVLIDGVVTRTEVLPGADQRHTTLQVTGDDLTAVMTKLEFSGLPGLPYPAMPAEAIVALLLAKYAFLGMIPLIVPSVMVHVPIPTARIHAQRGSDLAYIKDLAERVGYVFYLQPGPAIGTNVAYWGPLIKVGAPQPALSINMDAHTNVESLSFSFDNHQNAIPTVFWYDEITKVTTFIPIPPITPLSPPLGLVPPIPTRLVPVSDDLSKQALPQGIMIGLAKAAQWAEAVTGTGELNVLRYGRVLNARELVGVRGAGLAFDGLHYVKSVTHKIKRGEYKQSFNLSRNGLISTLPRVPV